MICVHIGEQKCYDVCLTFLKQYFGGKIYSSTVNEGKNTYQVISEYGRLPPLLFSNLFLAKANIKIISSFLRISTLILPPSQLVIGNSIVDRLDCIIPFCKTLKNSFESSERTVSLICLEMAFQPQMMHIFC